MIVSLVSPYRDARHRAREVVAEALRNSITAIAIDDATTAPVGIARVVTDRATFAWLCDVFVVEDYRGRGLASELIDTLERHPELQTLRRWCLITRDAHALYARRGYVPVAARGTTYQIYYETAGNQTRYSVNGGRIDISIDLAITSRGWSILGHSSKAMTMLEPSKIGRAHV